MNKNFIFSSESVGEGHPGQSLRHHFRCGAGRLHLAQDPRSRVACETYAKSNMVVVGGEITTKAKVNINDIVRECIRGNRLRE
jgi:S-adenosylmethionine synthetase